MKAERLMLSTLLVTLLAMSGADAVAQQARPQGWSVSVEAGTQFPTAAYDDWVRLTLPPLQQPGELTIQAIEVNTRWTEQFATMPVLRISTWYRPDAAFHLYTTLQHGAGRTTAHYHAGRDPPETIGRSARVLMVEGGVGIRLFRWADDRGGLGYTMGPVWAHHRLDLSAGHRRAFLRVDPAAPAPPPDNPQWSSRTWATWGLSVGGSLRHPLTDRLTVRLGGHMHVLPSQGSGVADQERRDIETFSAGRTPGVYVTPYTASQFSVRVGLEYTLGWLRTPWQGLFAPPLALPPPPHPTAEVLAATREAAGGDTATALGALRDRIGEQPGDASARRQLALLLAGSAEQRPALRVEAWDELRRAIALYPGDPELLTALGRVRGAMDRAAQEPREPPALSVSSISAVADPAGALAVAFGVRVGADSDGVVDLVVQVFGPGGRDVAASLDEAGGVPETRLELAGVALQDGLVRLNLRLARAAAGAYSVRVRVTDPATGLRADATGGFELR